MSSRVPVRCPEGERFDFFSGRCVPDALGAISHVRAREVLISAFRQRFGREANRCELQYAQAVALGEGGQYGAGCYKSFSYDNPGCRNKQLIDQNCDTGNWGAQQSRKTPPCPPGTIEATDTHPATGDCYQACFLTFATPEEGAAAFLGRLYGRGGTLAAAGRGDFDAAVAAQKATKYFEAPVEQYRSSVRTNAQKVARALGEPVCASPGVGDFGISASPLLVATAVGALAYAGWRWLT